MAQSLFPATPTGEDDHMKVKAFACAICMIAFAPISAMAQEMDMNASFQRQKQAKQNDPDPGKIEILRRQPIPFKPFEMIDVVTGRPIPPDSMLTLPDGQ